MSISNKMPMRATDATEPAMMAVTLGGSGHSGGRGIIYRKVYSKLQKKKKKKNEMEKKYMPADFF